MGKRARQRQRAAGGGGDAPSASPSEYRDEHGNVLALRGSLTPAARSEYASVLKGGLEREDAWQRATELLRS